MYWQSIILSARSQTSECEECEGLNDLWPRSANPKTVVAHCFLLSPRRISFNVRTESEGSLLTSGLDLIFRIQRASFDVDSLSGAVLDKSTTPRWNTQMKHLRKRIVGINRPLEEPSFRPGDTCDSSRRFGVLFTLCLDVPEFDQSRDKSLGEARNLLCDAWKF